MILIIEVGEWDWSKKVEMLNQVLEIWNMSCKG